MLMSRIALVAVIAVVAAVVAYVPSRRDRAGIRTLPARSTAALGAPSAGRDPAPVAEAPLADPPEADGPFADVYRFWRDLGFEEVVSKPFVLFNPGCGAWLYDGQLLYPLEYGWAMQTSSGAIVLRSATLKPTYYRSVGVHPGQMGGTQEPPSPGAAASWRVARCGLRALLQEPCRQRRASLSYV